LTKTDFSAEITRLHKKTESYQNLLQFINEKSTAIPLLSQKIISTISLWTIGL